MPRRISTLLGISENDLNKEGAFDRFIDIDSIFHVDPCLLKECNISEFKDSHEKFQKYFKRILSLVQRSRVNGDEKLLSKAYKRLQFKENRSIGLGYTKKGIEGKGIGTKLAKEILNTVSKIVENGISDPIIFQLLGIFEKGIGADRISDMTINILEENFVLYTQRVAKTLKLITKKFYIEGNEFLLPFDPITGDKIILIPKLLLNDLPISEILSKNAILRTKINKIIGENLQSTLKENKVELKKIIFQNPELISDLISQFKKINKYSYDFHNDPSGEILWAELSDKAAIYFPLHLKHYNPISLQDIHKIVKKICTQFKSILEDKGWSKYLYNNGKLKRERASQLLFYGIAEAYLTKNNLKVKILVKEKIGSFNFNILGNTEEFITVEINYSSNSSIKKKFREHISSHDKNIIKCSNIYLIIQTKEKSNSIDKIYKMAGRAKEAPEIIIIDGIYNSTQTNLIK